MDEINSNPKPVKLFIGMLSKEISLFDELKERLKEIFGAIDLESPAWEWNHTDYYSKEMGRGLKRKFIFFERLISPETISDIKLKTKELERQYVNENNPSEPPLENPPTPPLLKEGEGGVKRGARGFKSRRRINLDPGYLDLARVVLVSTKDFSHRIYLCNGIYAETTLVYSAEGAVREGGYHPLPWTYPDFRTEEYLSFFKKARGLYKKQG